MHRPVYGGLFFRPNSAGRVLSADAAIIVTCLGADMCVHVCFAALLTDMTDKPGPYLLYIKSGETGSVLTY